ncbi:MAG: MBL fold metallo-hydrolase [Thermoleophilia bacterium]
MVQSPSVAFPGRPDGMELHLLGSGGWFPTDRRATCCALVRDGDRGLLLDAGTGLGRLAERPELLAGLAALDLVLTHFHLDHVVGLATLPALPEALRPTIWAPGELLGVGASRPLLERLLGRPLFAAPLAAVAREVRELPAGPVELGPFRLATRVQRLHADPTLGLRLGDALAYCTDTERDPGSPSFAAGCRVLCHEAWHPTDAGPGHTSAADAGRLAAEAGVERLVLIHVNPLLADEAALEASARASFPATTVGRDLDLVAL